jgi:hypothetical protein
MLFRAVFWVVLQCKIILHGSTTQKTALNIFLPLQNTKYYAIHNSLPLASECSSYSQELYV